MNTNVSARTLHRRTVLRGFGAVISLPFLEAMLPNRGLLAASPNSKPPLRMAYFYVPNGANMANWTPVGTGGPLGDLTPTLQPLAPFKNKFSVLTGLTLDGAFDHGDGGGDHARSIAAFLTGAHPRKTEGADIKNDVSVDQVAAGKLGSATRFASLELGLEGSSQSGGCDSGYSCAYSSNMSWRNETTPVPKETDPGAVFDRLFGGLTKAEMVKSKDIRKKFRKSVLDFAVDDAKRLQGQLGQLDRQKLDEYLYAVRDVEKRLVGSEKLMLNEGGVPDYPRPAGVPSSLTEHAKLMLDMLTLSFQTDSTRIASFMMFNEGSNRGYPDLDVPEGHHDLSHHGKSEEKQRKIAIIDRYHVTMFAHLLSRIAVVPEGEGKLLDNCLIVYGSGISDGDRHNHDDLPILLAGGDAFGVKGGRHLVYPNRTPLCNLHLWMLEQLGVKQSKFGDSTGVLDKIV